MSKNQNYRTYQRITSAVFRKTKEKYGGLSNMASGYPIKINDISIRTSEALYQACRFPHLQDVQYTIIQQRSPMTAKMKSKPHRKKTRPDWFVVRVNIMRWCLRVKLAQNWKKFGSLLISTGDLPIVEESKKDGFWGAKPKGEDILVGKNVLGRLLMELREELLGPNAQLLTKIFPLEISDFRLYGKPIGIIEVPISEDITIKDLERRPPVEELIQQNAAITHQVSEDQHLFDSKPSITDVNQEDESKGFVLPKECKRLAEVDFPIAEVSKHSVREKSIRHGHPSTLHLWWARRPLASCRSMLMALLLPDPCDLHCPDDFKIKARKILFDHPNHPRGWSLRIKSDEGLRKVILEFIADFANWDRSSDKDYLKTGRELVRAAYPDEPPLVVDPFAGGGSIPLEALRLGCEAFASDLNPVACLILKVMLEDIPRHGPDLADELRRVGGEIKKQAEKELAEFYPKDPDGATPIAYLWARTVRCESPNCGTEIPLMRSFWLCKKVKRKRALRQRVIRPNGGLPYVEFEIFEPKTDKEVHGATVTRAKATCLCCGTVLPPERVRAQLSKQRGGGDVVFDTKGNRIGGARMLAVVTLCPSIQGRNYRLPTDRDFRPVWKAQRQLTTIIEGWERGGKKGLCPVPDEPLPYRHGHRSIQSPRVYGMHSWSDYYNARQNLSLSFLCQSVFKNGESSGMRAVTELSALLLSKFAELATANCRWEPVAECPRSLFTRHDLPAMWDFAEGVPISSSSGGFARTLHNVLGTLNKIGCNWRLGQVQQADARNSPLPSDSASVWFIDPPYYDAVAYADLSDFFYVWLKRTLPGHPLLKDCFDAKNPLVPKLQELTVTTVAGENDEPKSSSEFEQGVADSFAQGVGVLAEKGIGCVVFAHKTTEGWEALLTGMMTAGWVIVASWPVATEMGHRFNARGVSALATSIHLVCRPRAEDAPVGDWADVLRELPKRVGDWMERLQSEGIRGADLVFACIGPALEIYSRYSRVEDPGGNEIPLGGDPEASDPHLRGYLAYVWETVGRIALEQVLGTEEAKARNSAAGALEEDARLTALFLWTIQSTNGDQDAKKDDKAKASKAKSKGYSLIFDVARRFAQPLGINLPKWEGRIIETKKGIVRLFSVSERAKQLFGQEDARAVAYALEREPKTDPQLLLFPDLEAERIPKVRGQGRRRSKKGIISDASFEESPEATTLDRVHAAMLLQSGGQANALRALIKSEQERGPDFLRLANALSALYPKGSEEKRLVDAMLLAIPR